MVDALADDTSRGHLTADQPHHFLFARDGAVSTTTQAGVYQLVKVEQPSYAVFDLRDISLATPLRVHWNKMSR